MQYVGKKNEAVCPRGNGLKSMMERCLRKGGGTPSNGAVLGSPTVDLDQAPTSASQGSPTSLNRLSVM